MNSPRFIAEDWRTRVVHSEDPYTQMWRELFHFAGSNAAGRAFASAPDDTNISRFRSAITLADGFYTEFEDAVDLVDAVPLYYATYWLGMAAAFVTLGPADLGAASGNHGLKINITTSPLLAATTIEGRDASGACSVINKAFGGADADIMETSYSLLDLLRAIPQLNEDLRLVNSETSAFAFLSDPGELADGQRISGKIVAPYKVTDGYLRSALVAYDYLAQNGLTIDEGNARIEWVPTRHFSEEINQLCLAPANGTFFLTRISQRAIPEFTIYLMVLYGLSNIVRYNPHIWVPMRDSENDEYFVIRSFIHSAKKNIPRLVLNHLTKRTNAFVSDS